MLTITIYKPSPTNTLNAAGSGPPSPYTIQQLSAAAAAQEARTGEDTASDIASGHSHAEIAANAAAAAAVQAQAKLAFDIAHGADSAAILADTVSYLGDITITLGSAAVGYSDVPGAPDSELFHLIGQAALATGEFATTVGSMASDYDGTQKLLANSPQLNAFISESETAIDSIQSGLASLTSAVADVSNTFKSTLDLALSSTTSAVTSVSNMISDFGDANLPSLENTALTDLNATQVPIGNFANNIGMVIPNLTETSASVSSTDDTISIATGSAAPTSIINFNPTKDGSATAVSFDTENTVNNTSQITTFNPDGSSVTTFYNGPGGKGSVTEVDQENADGTSVITTYGPGGPTTINYSGPNGTGYVTKTDIESPVSSIVQNISEITYDYNGPGLSGSIVYYPTPTVIGSVQVGAVTLHGGGYTFTNFNGAQLSFDFNGKIAGWGVSAYLYASANSPSYGTAILSSTSPFEEYSVENVPTAGGGFTALNYVNANVAGIWTADTSSIQTAITITPLSGQVQQLSSALSKPALSAQGALQNLTINGPGTVAVTGSYRLPNIVNNGSIAIASGVSLQVTSRLVEDAGSAVTGVVAGVGAGTTIELASGKSGSISSGLSDIGTIAVDSGASWTVTGSYSLPNIVDNGTIVLASGASLQVTSRLVEGAGSAITGVVAGAGASTTIELASGKSGSISSGLSNIGKIAVDAGASWTVSGSYSLPNIIDNGTIVIGTGSGLDIFTALDPASTGIFQLQNSSTLELAAALGHNTQIQFLGSSNDKLVIDKASSFGTSVGTTSYTGSLLENFSSGDVIDLKGIASTGLKLNYSAASGDLQIAGSSGNALATLAFQSSTLGAGSFHIASDGTGGTLLTHS